MSLLLLSVATDAKNNKKPYNIYNIYRVHFLFNIQVLIRFPVRTFGTLGEKIWEVR
jgi:hypothetical protein